MGTEVTQIECGRKHTLAFVPTRGRLYAFGLGGSGQLGNSVYTSATTPQGKFFNPFKMPFFMYWYLHTTFFFFMAKFLPDLKLRIFEKDKKILKA